MEIDDAIALLRSKKARSSAAPASQAARPAEEEEVQCMGVVTTQTIPPKRYEGVESIKRRARSLGPVYSLGEVREMGALKIEGLVVGLVLKAEHAGRAMRVLLCDETGEMEASIHPRAISAAGGVSEGMLIAIRNPSVWRHKAPCINVVAENLVRELIAR